MNDKLVTNSENFVFLNKGNTPDFKKIARENLGCEIRGHIYGSTVALSVDRNPLMWSYFDLHDYTHYGGELAYESDYEESMICKSQVMVDNVLESMSRW